MEPIFTVNMSVDSIKKLSEVPLTMESYSKHTQSRKHDVQEVSKASEAVYGEDKLERWLGKS